MSKLVSIDRIEEAFNEGIKTIDKIEETLESHIEIEINEHKLAQLEKINYVDSSVAQLELKIKTIPYNSTFKFAFSR